MAFLRIFYWLGSAVVLHSLLMILTAFAALVLGEFAWAQLFAILGLVFGVLGLIMTFIGQNAPTGETTKDVLLFLVGFWLIIPLLTAVPFLALPGRPEFNLAWFEAVSAVTTTGASTFDTDNLPRTIILWRALLNWSGGCMVATLAIVVLAALNLSGIGEHRSSLFTLEKGAIFKHLFDIGRLVTAIYSGLVLVCITGLVVFGTPLFEAICLSLSAISTGGFTPRSGPIANYVSGFGGIILAIICLLGAANLALVWDLIRKRDKTSLKALFSRAEHRGIAVIIGLLLVGGFIATGGAHFLTLLLESVFMATTTGFDYHVVGIDILPPIILIAFVLIGGSALSTAGGIKILRLLLLFVHLRTDLDRMSLPRRVMPVKFQGRIIDDKAFLSIWMYFFAYTLVMALGIMALGVVGMDLDIAISASASAMSNTGPLLAATNPEHGYNEFSPLALSVLAVIMLVGRMEVLAVFALLSPSLWRN